MYNGWENYPTWCVNLWLTNDEGLYLDMLDFVAGLLDDELSKYDITNSIKEHIENQFRYIDDEASLRTDMLGYAFGIVDWNAIADSWIEMTKDYFGEE
jgi:hypothetical protein